MVVLWISFKTNFIFFSFHERHCDTRLELHSTWFVKTLSKMDSQNLLHEAVEDGNVEFLVQQIEKGVVDINEGKSNGVTLMDTAVSNDKFKVVKMFLEKRAKLDQQTKGFGMQLPLHLAAYKGCNEIVKLLLENGAEANIAINGITPLHFAISNCNYETIDLLLKKTHNVNSKDDSKGFSLLHLAVSTHLQGKSKTKFAKHLEMVYGDSKQNDMMTQSHRADMVKTLLQRGANYDEKTKMNQTPLLLATENGFLEAAKILIEKGAKVNVQDNRKFTPLHNALFFDNEEFIKFLIDQNASINVSSVNGTFPIHVASSNGHAKIVKLLIDHGADIEVIDIIEHNKPIHYAARFGQLKVAKLLLENGTNINERNKIGERPITLAVHNGQLEMTKLLIQNGAELNFNDNDHLIPLHFAVSDGTNITRLKAIVMSCILNGMKFCECTHKFFQGSGIYVPEEIVDVLIRNGADVDLWNKADNHLPLFHISMIVNTKILSRLLLYSKVDINAMSFNDETLLHFAIRLGLTESIKILIQHGASLNSKIGDLNSPLELVLGKKHPNDLKHILYLQQDF